MAFPKKRSTAKTLLLQLESFFDDAPFLTIEKTLKNYREILPATVAVLAQVKKDIGSVVSPVYIALSSDAATIELQVLFPSMSRDKSTALPLDPLDPLHKNALSAYNRWFYRVLMSTQFSANKKTCSSKCPGTYNTFACGIRQFKQKANDAIKKDTQHRKYALYKLNPVKEFSTYLKEASLLLDTLYSDMEIYDGCEYNVTSSNGQFTLRLDPSSGLQMVRNSGGGGGGGGASISCSAVGGQDGQVVATIPPTNLIPDIATTIAYSKAVMSSDGTISLFATDSARNETTRVWSSVAPSGSPPFAMTLENDGQLTVTDNRGVSVGTFPTLTDPGFTGFKSISHATSSRTATMSPALYSTLSRISTMSTISGLAATGSTGTISNDSVNDSDSAYGIVHAAFPSSC
jgi:hypothetical protein